MTEPEDRVDLMPPPPPDPRKGANLLARARDGDSMAWEELFRRYHRLVRSTVTSYRLQEADADEAMQNTWLRVRADKHDQRPGASGRLASDHGQPRVPGTDPAQAPRGHGHAPGQHRAHPSTSVAAAVGHTKTARFRPSVRS